MRFSQVQSSRLHYYDRSPTNRTYVYQVAAIGPHIYTVEWSYTCPAGHKSNIDVMFCYLRRITAAAPVGDAECGIEYTGFGLANFDLIRASLYDNALFALDKVGPATGGIMLPGDSIKGWTIDTSTGGTIGYTVGAKIFEFDA